MAAFAPNRKLFWTRDGIIRSGRNGKSGRSFPGQRHWWDGEDRALAAASATDSFKADAAANRNCAV